MPNGFFGFDGIAIVYEPYGVIRMQSDTCCVQVPLRPPPLALTQFCPKVLRLVHSIQMLSPRNGKQLTSLHRGNKIKTGKRHKRELKRFFF